MKRSRLKRWLMALGATIIILLIAAIVAATIALKPYRERAQTFDLSMVPHESAVDLNRVPQHVIDAVVASEDSRFYAHGGFDLKGICRAAWVNFRGKGNRQGASTITQQLARQSYNLLDKSIDRKLVEVCLARRIEEAYDKETILSNYLSIIYFGNSFFGIEAASQGYFNKPVEDLTVTEGATLAGLIKAPSLLEPFQHPEKAREARNLVLGRMASENLLSDEEAQRLREQPIRVKHEGDGTPM